MDQNIRAVRFILRITRYSLKVQFYSVIVAINDSGNDILEWVEVKSPEDISQAPFEKYYPVSSTSAPTPSGPGGSARLWSILDSLPYFSAPGSNMAILSVSDEQKKVSPDGEYYQIVANLKRDSQKSYLFGIYYNPEYDFAEITEVMELGSDYTISEERVLSDKDALAAAKFKSVMSALENDTKFGPIVSDKDKIQYVGSQFDKISGNTLFRIILQDVRSKQMERDYELIMGVSSQGSAYLVKWQQSNEGYRPIRNMDTGSMKNIVGSYLADQDLTGTATVDYKSILVRSIGSHDQFYRVLVTSNDYNSNVVIFAPSSNPGHYSVQGIEKVD